MSVKIIADIGINHDGDHIKMFDLIQIAKDSNVDFVKFQMWFHDQWPDLEDYKFTELEWHEIFSFSERIQVECFATCFDEQAMEFCYQNGMKIWKVPSGMVTNDAYLYKIRKYREKSDGQSMMSSGLCNQSEVLAACKKLGSYENVLHCVSTYPAKPEDMNLQNLKKWPYVGLSDHTEGDEVAIAAVAMGAAIIEKHLTLDRNAEGPDHKASMDPEGFANMVRRIRNVERAMAGSDKPAKGETYEIRNAIRRRMAL
jgi:N,N'-diacetyllegionaminate synthase